MLFSFFQAISHNWNHDTDPVESLQINKFVDKFREKLKEDPKFLQNKVKSYFIFDSFMIMVITIKQCGRIHMVLHSCQVVGVHM